jgi:hypothetical protein
LMRSASSRARKGRGRATAASRMCISSPCSERWFCAARRYGSARQPAFRASSSSVRPGASPFGHNFTSC